VREGGWNWGENEERGDRDVRLGVQLLIWVRMIDWHMDL
jgi:hypothetical protein